MISVKESKQAQIMIRILFYAPFLFGILIELLRLPGMIKYICDLAWIYLGILILMQRKRFIKEERIVIGSMFFFLVYTFFSYILNFQSIYFYIWGVRNNFRFYVAFVAFVYFLKKENVDGKLKCLDKLFWINVLVCLIQYFGLGYEQDHLGGLFGTDLGCNAYINNFFVIISIKVILEYLNNREKLKYFLMKSIIVLFISALAELKFFYVEFIMIIVLAIVLTDFSWKKIIIALMGTLGTIVAITFLISLFPEFTEIFSIHGLIESASSAEGYTGRGDVNRLTAIPVISDRFLTSLPKKLFGLGLGNCDTATFEFLNTSFFRKHSWMNYSVFSVAFVFIETGFLGLIFYSFIYISIIIGVCRIMKKYPEDKQYCQMAIITAAICLLIMIYNSSLRTEAAYMMYFVMAIPFAINRRHKKEDLFHEKAT